MISRLIIQHRLNGYLYGQSEFQICGSIAEVHNDMFKFSVDIYKDLLIDFENLKQLLKLNGVSKLKIIKNTKDLQFEKYCMLMGFFNSTTLDIDGKNIYYAEMEI